MFPTRDLTEFDTIREGKDNDVPGTAYVFPLVRWKGRSS
jgi:hypothetical protein